MVIQSNMPIAGIVLAWKITKEIFEKHGIDTSTNESLQEVISEDKLQSFIDELNNTINSSDVTCIEGG